VLGQLRDEVGRASRVDVGDHERGGDGRPGRRPVDAGVGEPGLGRRRPQQQHVVGVHQGGVGRVAVPLPHRPAVEGRQGSATRLHVGEAPQPDEAVGIVEIAEAGRDGHSERLLRLEELALEQVDEHVALPPVQRVLPQLEDGAAGGRRVRKGHARDGRTTHPTGSSLRDMDRRAAAAGSSLFFALAPGTMVGLLPWLITRWRVETPVEPWQPARWLGALVLLTSAAFVVHAFLRFAVDGLGTPAPVAPTEQLVVTGVYRHVRNPMYLAVTGVILGQALLLGQLSLVLYAAAFLVVTMAFARWYEEPALARRFPQEYPAYREQVPGWWPRLRPWSPG
jgi:protein-S-isoprenylcysteine O-methyltransferase Ste14